MAICYFCWFGGNGYIFNVTEKRSFLCAENTVDVAMQFRKKLGARFFGGKGLFLTTLEGPGTVWLQTMPISKLAGLLYMGTAK